MESQNTSCDIECMMKLSLMNKRFILTRSILTVIKWLPLKITNLCQGARARKSDL